MSIAIYIDNNVWDFLFERNLDLSVELPSAEFCLCLTREAEFEIPPIPREKEALKSYIETTLEKCVVKTDSYFGFYNDAHSPNEQRMGDFNVGRWATPEELAFLEQQRTRLGGKKPTTKLYKNEADISIAARSFHSVVLSLDRTGPINEAYKQGGKVVFLTEFDDSGLSLANFIKSFCP
jgi:hypothetical protein